MASRQIIPNEKHDRYDFISPLANLKDAAKGKTVMITGSGTGVGRATAHTFAAAGASHLILVARRREPLEGTKTYVQTDYPSVTISVIPTDITSWSSVSSLFSNLGEGVVPDVLINNAGRGGKMVEIDADEDEEEIGRWWFDFEVNARGVYLMTRAFLKLLKRVAPGKRARVVNLSSNGSWKEIPGLSGYAMSKAAVNRFSEFVDAENKEAGIRCFALHPGGVAGTDLVSQTQAPEWLLKLLIDTPELGASTALYLTTDRADFLGGRFVSSTWDMEKAEAAKEEIVKDNLFKTRVLGVVE